MLPTLGIMIAVYGSARLINDAMAKEDNTAGHFVTYLTSIAGIAALWWLALAMLGLGSDLNL